VRFQANALRDTLADFGRRLRQVERFAAASTFIEWTPLLLGTAGNNPANDPSGSRGLFVRHNELIIAHFSIGLASYTAVPAIPYSVSLPVPFQFSSASVAMGGTWKGESAALVQVAVGHMDGFGVSGAPLFLIDRVYPRFLDAHPVGTESLLYDTAPWTWGNGDSLAGWFWYRVAPTT